MKKLAESFRIVRKSLSKSQTEFADALGLTQKTISAYETCTAPIPDRLIKTICTMYGINEDWFRTGEGDMYKPLTEDEALAETFGSILSDETDPSKRAAVKGVLALLDQIPPEFYPEIADFCEKLAKHKK